MPSIYTYYNTSDTSYTFSIINKNVSSNKKTRIYLGDTTNEIYTDASNQLNITSNLDIEQSLNVTTNLTAGGQLSIGYTSNPSPNYNVLAKNNKVAINKADVDSQYTLIVGGSTKIDTDLYVAGQTTLVGALNLNGNLNIDTSKFQVNATTGNTSITGDLTVNGSTYLGNQTTDTVTISGDLTVAGNLLGRFPLGGIIPLITGYFTNNNNIGFTSVSSLVPTSGQITPEGYLLCDGGLIPTTANSLLASIFGGQDRYTPNLTDNRFLQGSTTSGNIGSNTTNEISLSTSNLPSHSHTIDHSHSGNVTTNGNHRHTYTLSKNDANSSHNPGEHPVGDSTPGSQGSQDYNTYTDYDGNHSHTFSVSHTGSSGLIGSGLAFDIRPKYINVIYVMRVK